MTTQTENPGFQPTRWSLVARAYRDEDDRDARRRMEALETLCRLYWTPLFVFVRRQGNSAADAEDLIQGFFARILEKDFFDTAVPEKGRLRSFLLSALKNHLVDEHRAQAAAKRGGGVLPVSIDAESAEHSGAWQIASQDTTPEEAYEHRWVCALLEHGLERLRQEYEDAGKGPQFEALCPLLTPGTGATTAEAAAMLGAREGTVRVALSRLRKRFGEIVTEEIQATLLPGEDPADEIRALMVIVGR